MSKYHAYYFDGREAAAEDGAEELDLDEDGDFDLDHLARRILDGEPADEVVAEAIAAERAKADLTGAEKEWTRARKKALKHDGVEPAKAYEEYVRGWTDQARKDLNDAVVDAMYELDGEGDEDEDDESDGEEEEGGDGEGDEDGEDRRQ